ncbi:hypothetical protein SAY87_027259 [Trapa incisa]|uniref:Uncharacterized protein n=1 Tax=Trapa incisa TaxID=236973 RepID=A0AAN7GN39_9MYRT|nr:hypothetical protein SAY87_027259 [Trapa incisa]
MAKGGDVGRGGENEATSLLRWIWQIISSVMISKQSERSVKYHRDMARAALLLVLMLVVFGDLFTVSDARPGNTGAVPYSSRYLLLELGYDVERLQGRGSGSGVRIIPSRSAPGGPDGQHHE